MGLQMAKRMERLPEQFFAQLSSRVLQAVQAGRDVINLGQGNPDLPTASHIVEALREAALDPATHRYAPFSGLPSLKEAVAEFYLREYGVTLHPEHEVAILFGGKAGLVELSEIYLDAGDVALVPDPGYPDYWSGVALAGGRMVKLPLTPDNRFLPDLEAVSTTDWQKAKLLFLNYPNNPTGAVATLDYFAKCAEVASSHGTLVVHDFAYGAIGFDGVKPPSFLQAEGAKEAGIEIYTLSKTFNMAGWRVAFAVGRRDVIAAINLLQDHYYVSLFPAVQRAAIAALLGPQDCVRDLRATYERRRNAWVGALTAHGIHCPPPKGSFFAWMPVPTGLNSSEYADLLFEQVDVAVAPGRGFGEQGDNHVRIGLLTPEGRLAEAAERVAQVHAALRLPDCLL